MRSTLIISLLAAVVLVPGCATSHTSATASEYKVVQGYVPSAIEKELNQLGGEGWVVASSTSPAPHGDNTPAIVIILKRDKK